MGVLSKLFGTKAPMVRPVHIDDRNFKQEVLRSELPVLLDVWGPGCVPCKQLEPIVMRLAARYQGRLKVAEVSVADAPLTASRLGVMGTPTVIYFRGGRERERVVGFRGELYHTQYIDEELLGR